MATNEEASGGVASDWEAESGAESHSSDAAKLTDASTSGSSSDSDSASDSDDSDASNKSTAATSTTSTQVLDGYRKLSSRRVDLVGDYAGDELFLIEGDSMLLHCFSDDKLDFGDGFQMLHAAYTVEYFLHNLAKRKCNFHIAFFEQHRHLCVPEGTSDLNRPKYFLARAAIIRHLQTALAKSDLGVQISLFSSVNSPAFARYLEDTGMYFMMCHDGASPVQSARNKVIKASKLELAIDGASEPRLAFRAMILNFVARGYNVALVNGLEWRDTKVMTMVLEASRRRDPVDTSSDTDEEPVVKPATAAWAMSFLSVLAGNGLHLDVREQLAIVTVARVLESQSLTPAMLAAFFLHLVLLKLLPLADRRLDKPSINEHSRQFLASFSEAGESLILGDAWWEVLRSSPDSAGLVVDLVDGRLLSAACCRHEQVVKDLAVSYAEATKLLTKAVPEEVWALIKRDDLHSGSQKARRAPKVSNDLAVMPFSNPVFDKHLASIHLQIDEAAAGEQSKSSERVFQEVTHWHNAKKPLITKPTTPAATAKAAKDEFWAQRRNQWFMAEMTTYAASLTNAVGRSLEPEIIVVGSTKALPIREAPVEDNKAKGKPTEKSDKKKGGGKNAKQNALKQARMDSISSVAAKKEGQNNEKVVFAWHVACKNLEAEKDLPARYNLAKEYLASLQKSKREVVGAEVELYILGILISRWISICRAKEQRERSGLAALIWHTARNLLGSAGVTNTIATKVELTFRLLNLPPVPVEVPTYDRDLTFRFQLPMAAPEALAISLTSKDFQLLHCGPYLDRSIDSAPDHRVEFDPDGWQRKVLDGIDANRSLFVVAPTSAGKTFISFYAMRKILETDDDGVLVYVAPTKALVNQIAAEIQARYSKKFKYAGKSVWAIHTRDYRINSPTGCQVLVTVPHILQIMLMAPTNASSWSSRVKRIIFDEVHSIGQAEDGVVWEQLLLLAPCPIIALSATVGNPQEFSGWLQSTQKAIGQDLEMVQHSVRYSDLRKFYYRAPKAFVFRGLPDRKSFAGLGLDGTPGFAFVHPIASLINKSRGMPEDLSLEARDCFSLWQAMVRNQTKTHPVSSKLDPANALPKIVRKADTLEWEKSLKTLLRAWMADNSSPFDSVMAELGRSFHTADREELHVSRGSATDGGGSRVDADSLRKTTLPMLCKLHEQDALPAILFNYDRGQCERMCRDIVDQLQLAEKTWKESSTRWRSTLKAWEDWKAVQAKLAAKKGPKAPKGAGKKMSKEDREEAEGEKVSKADSTRDAAGAEYSAFDSFDPEAPQDGFHFADHRKLQTSELDEYIRQLGRRNVQQWLIDAVSRGIGVHHAGMNRKYRQVVEILFRKGFLRVVVATGTLALGINMPCKTVVFSGDSVFLTALNFRQGAGRAGRRGFDLLGNVVFQNISEAKVCRLLSSRLPDLNGHFPVTTTLVLRLFTLLSDSKNSQYAVKAINSLLSQPRLYMGGPAFKDQTLHHLRFSIEYLRRQYLLDSRGAPLNFAGLVSHLYFTENASFAFHALLKEGFFHELCSDIDTKEKDTLESLMLTMAHLFGRVYCRQSDEEYRENVVKRSSSIVFLPPLPKKAARILREHNQQTLDVFRTYVETFIDQHIEEKDCRLPLTGTHAGGDSGGNEHATESDFSLPPTHIRSSFVALSGHGDQFSSISDLCRTTRDGVFLEESVIPHVGLYPDEMDVPLNAYLLDFYKHGDVKTLARANQIRAGEVWFLLNDFSMVLATIITSLMTFMKLKPGTDMDMIDVMGNLDAYEEAEDDKAAVTETTDTSTPVIADPASNPTKPVMAKMKARNIESWEEVADKEDAIAGADGRKAAKSKAYKQNGADERDAPAWETGGDEGLVKLLKALQKLNVEFNLKFRAMWA
ncbi:hypothetical protein LTR66_007187 [Elasticomyces elasticus]|nr:hypothetical protein LTR66_007187 [Elasticomyces elasticus]